MWGFAGGGADVLPEMIDPPLPWASCNPKKSAAGQGANCITFERLRVCVCECECENAGRHNHKVIQFSTVRII